MDVSSHQTFFDRFLTNTLNLPALCFSNNSQGAMMQVLVRIVDLKNKAVNYVTSKNRFIREQ